MSFDADAAPAIEIFANGRAVAMPAGSTLHDLVVELGVERCVAAVEHNGEPVTRRALPATHLEPGDRIELVRATAGG